MFYLIVLIINTNILYDHMIHFPPNKASLLPSYTTSHKHSFKNKETVLADSALIDRESRGLLYVFFVSVCECNSKEFIFYLILFHVSLFSSVILWQLHSRLYVYVCVLFSESLQSIIISPLSHKNCKGLEKYNKCDRTILIQFCNFVVIFSLDF